MTWDVVDADFGGDETANFGPRTESGTALYQIDTLATVSSRGEIYRSEPNVVTSVLGDFACLAVESHISILKDCQFCVTLALNACVDAVEWSPDGCLLVIGDVSGRLYVVDTDTLEIEFSGNICAPGEDEHTFKRIIFNSKTESEYDVIILGSAGKLMVLPDIKREFFLSTSNKSKLSMLLVEKLCTASTEAYHTEGVMDVVSHNGLIITMGKGNQILAVWKEEDGRLELQDVVDQNECGDGIKQAKISTDGNFLFLLDTNNCLTLWNAHLLVMLQEMSDQQIQEFQVLETKEIRNHSLIGMKMIMLTIPCDGQSTLLIQNLPQCETVYTLQLSSPTVISNCLVIQETLYVAECCRDSLTGEVSNVRFRCLTETNPETRLYRFLRRNKFEEAEEFAKLFQLDSEIVHKEKVNYILEQLSHWNIEKYNDDKVTEMSSSLWTCLESIKDDLHVAEIGMRAAMPDIETTQQLLTYCRKRLDKLNIGKVEGAHKEKLTSILTKWYDIQNRLITFGLVVGDKMYSGERWDKFLKADLMQECLLLFEQRHMISGLYIWIRHQTEWEKKITENIFEKLLSRIPRHVAACEILGLMRDNLIPSVARLLPESLIKLTNWIIGRAKNMELSEKEDWPMNCITFLKSVLKGLMKATEITHTEFTSTAADLANKTKMNARDVVEPVQTLINNLQHLYDLHHRYKCRLTFGQFMQETTETVTFRMLDQVVAVELISHTLDTQIRPYMREHRLKEDVIFSKYVKDLLERTGTVKSYLGETPWEGKAIAVINCISGSEEKCDAILETIQWAPIPWTSEISKLVEIGLKIDHPKVLDLKRQIHLVEVKKLMLKYGLRNMEVPKKSCAEQLLYHILSHDVPSSMEDALKVMAAYSLSLEKDLYIFRLRYLITKEKIEDALELLKSLPQDMGYACGLRILSFEKVCLDDSINFCNVEEECCKMKKLFTEAAVYITRFLIPLTQEELTVVDWYVRQWYSGYTSVEHWTSATINDELELEELKSLLLNLQRVWSLQTEFNKYLTLEQYCDCVYRESVLMGYMTEFYMTKSKGEKIDYFKAYRLAEILQISRIKLQVELIKEAARTGEVQAAIKMSSDLLEYDHTVETADMLFQVSSALLHLQADNDKVTHLGDLLHLTDRIIEQALCLCRPDKLLQYLELCKVVQLALSVNKQCEVGETTLQNSENEVPCDLFSKWSLDSTFNEDALVMNSSIILPTAAKYAVTQSSIFEQEYIEEEEADSRSPLKSMASDVYPIIQHLKDNNHMILAYQYLVHMTSTAAQFLTKYQMGFEIMDKKAAFLERETEVLKEIEKFQRPMNKEICTNILLKIFNSQQIDHLLALTFLASMTGKEEILMKIIKSSGYNYKKLQAVANVGIGLGEMFREPKCIDMCQTLEKNASWGHRLSKIKISFKEAFQGPMSEKMKLLPQIAQCEAADMKLVKEFCRAFNLDEDAGLLLYLESVFTSPTNETLSVISKRSQLTKAKMAIQEVSNKDHLLEKLNDIYSKTDTYDYESLQLLLEAMQRIEPNQRNEMGLELLHYLKVYTRNSEPTEYELRFKPQGGEKEDLQLIMNTLPSSSRTRLPFHPLINDAWKIITPELQIDTVESWLPIATLLKLPTDQIYLLTARNMVSKHVEMKKQPGHSIMTDKSQWNWNVKDANINLMTQVQKLLCNVSNCELAIACANWMVKELPLGAEKVKALEGCIKYAELWYNTAKPEQTSYKERAKAAYTKFSRLWKRLATEQVLFLYKITDTELIRMAGNAKDLLVKLYEHPSVVDTDSEKIDIHTIAEEIAEINGINLKGLRITLLDKWLPSQSAKESEQESTMTFSFDKLKLQEESTMAADDDDENLKRVLYILQQGSTEENIGYLLNFAFKQDDSTASTTNMCRIRALHCVLRLDDEDTIVKMSGTTLANIREMLHILTYLVDLEKLHIQHSIETFKQANKEGLIKGVWRNHRHQKTAALLVSALCLDYGVHDKELWNSVLQQIFSFGLLAPLEYILQKLSGVKEMRLIPNLPKMWQVVLTTPLTKVTSPLTPEQTETCVQYFNLIFICPVLSEVDLHAIAKLYFKLDLPACSLGCVLMSRGDKQQIMRTITNLKETVISNAECLLKYGLDMSTYRTIISFFESDI